MQKAPLVLLVFVGVSGVMLISALVAFLHADVQVAYVSVEPARQLAYRLDIAGLNAFATADPTDRGAFVAALAVGSSLLVVRAQHRTSRELRQKIQKSRYYEVFVALRGTPTASGRIVVVDAGADGILSAVPGAKDVDIVEEDSRATRFDGDLAAQHLSASEYDAELAGADAAYARLLRVLLAAINDSR